MTTISKSSVDVLGKKYKKYNLQSSDRVYYGDRPYKVVLDIKRPGEGLLGESNRFHWWTWIDNIRRQLAYDGETDVRTQGRFPNLSLYLREKKGVDLLTKYFGDRIISISAPTSDEHLDMLFSNRNIQIRRILYFNKYPMRLDVEIPWRRYGLSNYNERRRVIQEVKDFISDQDTLDGRLSSTRWRCTYFTHPDEIKPILPFIKMQWPEVEFVYTDCYLPGSI